MICTPILQKCFHLESEFKQNREVSFFAVAVPRWSSASTSSLVIVWTTPATISGGSIWRITLTLTSPSSNAQCHSAERLVWILFTNLADRGAASRGARPSGWAIYSCSSQPKKLHQAGARDRGNRWIVREIEQQLFEGDAVAEDGMVALAGRLLAADHPLAGLR